MSQNQCCPTWNRRGKLPFSLGENQKAKIMRERTDKHITFDLLALITASATCGDSASG
jgi:hypothetical protein